MRYGNTKYNVSRNEGNFLVKQNIKHYVYSVRQDRESSIRCVGPVDDNGTALPQIIGEADSYATMESNLGEAFALTRAACYMGDKSYTLIDPNTGFESMLDVFHKAVNGYAKEHPQTASKRLRSWCGLRGEGEKTAPKAKLSKPRDVLLVQCLLFRSAGEDMPTDRTTGRIQPKMPVIMMLKGELCRTMLKALYGRGKSYLKGPRREEIDREPLGELFDLEEGHMLSFKPVTIKRDTGMTFSTHEPVVEETEPLDPAIQQEVWTPWTDILNLEITAEETMRLLADTFTPEAVVYAFEEHPDYGPLIPQEIREQMERQVASDFGLIRSAPAPRRAAATGTAPSRRFGAPSSEEEPSEEEADVTEALEEQPEEDNTPVEVEERETTPPPPPRFVAPRTAAPRPAPAPRGVQTATTTPPRPLPRTSDPKLQQLAEKLKQQQAGKR